MNIPGGPGAAGLQHMAARAQEARQPRAHTPQTGAETAAAGNSAPAGGENLPAATAGTASSTHPEHATGLERALERLQQNAAKSPQAKGLQQALEMLARNADRVGTVDVEA